MEFAYIFPLEDHHAKMHSSHLARIGPIQGLLHMLLEFLPSSFLQPVGMSHQSQSHMFGYIPPHIFKKKKNLLSLLAAFFLNFCYSLLSSDSSRDDAITIRNYVLQGT